MARGRPDAMSVSTRRRATAKWTSQKVPNGRRSAVPWLSCGRYRGGQPVLSAVRGAAWVPRRDLTAFGTETKLSKRCIVSGHGVCDLDSTPEKESCRARGSSSTQAASLERPEADPREDRDVTAKPHPRLAQGVLMRSGAILATLSLCAVWTGLAYPNSPLIFPVNPWAVNCNSYWGTCNLPNQWHLGEDVPEQRLLPL
jgi:hypothetical protein